MPRRGGISCVPGMSRRYESVVRTDEQPLANKQPLAKQQLSGKINSINEHLRDQKSLDTLFRRSVVASGLIANEQWEYCLRLLRHRMLSAQAKNSDVDEDQILREVLVEQGALTEYQALQLLDGKTKFRLGPYVITDFIGQGGMGQVFKAIHQVMGRECAVKVLPLHRITEESLTGFMREIRLQAKLDCPYLVRAHDAGQDGSVHYLVTEYVPGMDLRRLVKSRGKLTQDQASGIVMQAASKMP